LLLKLRILLVLGGGLIAVWDGSLRAVVNLESIFGLIFLACIWLRSGKLAPSEEDHPMLWHWALAALLPATVLVFWPGLHDYFVSDDFALLSTARVPVTIQLLYDFQRPVFFRPLVFLAYRWAYLMAGEEPWRWHIIAIVIHVTICWMIYLFGKRLYRRREVGFWAAAIFAWHGLRPEVVAWNTGLFDLLATGLGLGALLLLLIDLDQPGPIVAAAALICEIGALLAKESTYCLPLLAALLALWRSPQQWRRVLSFWMVAMGMFAVRWYALGGFGGYAVHINAVHTAEALGLRIWGLLWFPVNWTVAAGGALRFTLALAIGGAVLLSWTQASRRNLALPLGFVLLASLPVLSQLLVRADLLGSRCLYLPSIGFALLIGVALQSMAPSKLRFAAGAVLLLFQLATIEHNLAVWGEVATLSKRTCESAVAQLTDDEAEATVAGVPSFIHGVQFYNIGLPECIAMHGKRAHIHMVPEGTSGATLVWDQTLLSLVRPARIRKALVEGSDVP
jgi:hypothetical protein